ncbi:MAG: hypothetical protein GXN92_03720 [Candidatus Micrarchaeota archaeon]|nr:hypothetical protein [Candidatus Micrarchaeota archaeon]
MAKKEDIERIIQYCEQKKKETKRIALIVENPFREEIPWTFNYPYIAIDLPEENVNPSFLLYNSVDKMLYRYYDGEWIPITEEPEDVWDL